MQNLIRNFIISCCVLSASILQSVDARVVEQLTLARVPVADRSDIEFARGTAKALESVLVKLTGDSRTPRTERGRAVLAKAQRLIQQFGYEKPAVSVSDDELLLRVEFDPQVLTDEMRANGLVLWGKERPEIRLYIAVDTPTGRQLLSSEQPPADTAAATIRTIVMRQARNRGIPISFPEPALAALAGSHRDPASILAEALSAEQDSGLDGIAVAVFNGSEIGIWEAEWVFQLAEQRESFTNQGDLLALLAEEATDSLADVIGRRYANPVLLGHKESISLTIVGLYDDNDFARVTNYLDSLDGVDDLFIHQVANDGMAITAVVQGGYAGLEQSLAFGKILVPVDGERGQFRLVAR